MAYLGRAGFAPVVIFDAPAGFAFYIWKHLITWATGGSEITPDIGQDKNIEAGNCPAGSDPYFLLNIKYISGWLLPIGRKLTITERWS